MNDKLYRKIATKISKDGVSGAREVLSKQLTDNQLMKAVGTAFLDALDSYDELEEDCRKLEKKYCAHTADGHKINIGDIVYYAYGSDVTKCKVTGYVRLQRLVSPIIDSYFIDKTIYVSYYDDNAMKFKTITVLEQSLFSNKTLADQFKNSMV